MRKFRYAQIAMQLNAKQMISQMSGQFWQSKQLQGAMPWHFTTDSQLPTEEADGHVGEQEGCD